MAKAKLTKDDLPLSFGAFAPVRYVVVALPDASSAQQAQSALQDQGFGADDVLSFTDEEMAGRLKAVLPDVSGAAGFGSEIQSMRSYYELALQGHHWLLVHAPETAQSAKVAELAKQHGAKLATKYNMMTVEDLI
jgi:hypothetical protein